MRFFKKLLVPALTVLAALVLTGLSSIPVVYAANGQVPANCQTNPDAILSSSAIGLPTYGCGNDRSIIQTVLQLTFGALALASLLFIVIGGLKYTLSGGDSNAIASAKNTILYAVLGLVLGVSVFTLVGFIFSQVSR